MQNIIFERIWGKNFRRHLELDMDFRTNKLIAITGKNGQGKSSYLMAISTLLYGETPDGVKISRLVNNKIGKDLELHGNIRIDKDLYIIDRYYKHKKFKDALVLQKNGVNISSDTTTETYKLISKLIFPKDVFLNTCYFSQQVKDFFTALADSKQKDIFNAILDLKIYELYLDHTKSLREKTNNEVESLKEKKIAKYNECQQINIKLQYETESVLNKRKDRKIKIDELIKKKADLELEGVEIENKLKLLKYSQKVHEDLIAKVAIETQKLNNTDLDFIEFKKTIEKEIQKAKENIQAQYQIIFGEEKQKIESSVNDDQKIATAKTSDLMKKKDTIKTEQRAQQDKMNEKYMSDKNADDTIKDGLESEVIKLEQDHNNKVKDLSTKKDKDLVELVHRKDQIKIRLESIKKEADKYKVDKQDLVNKRTINIESLNKEVPVCPTCNQELKDENAQAHLKNEVEDLTNKINKIDAVIEELKKSFGPFKEEYDAIPIKVSRVTDTYEKNVKDLCILNGASHSALQEKISQVEFKLEQIEEKHKLEYSEYNSGIDKQITDIDIEISDIEKVMYNKRSEVNTKLLDIKNRLIKEANLKVIEQMGTLQRSVLDREESDKVVKEDLSKSIASSNSIISKLEESKKSIESLKSRVATLTQLIYPIENDVKIIQNETDDMSNINKYKENVTRLEDEQINLQKTYKDLVERLEILDFWKTGFSDKGLPSMLIDNAIPFMNTTVREILDIIAPGKYIVSFDTISETKAGDVRDRFAVNILNTESGADHHSLLSGGEKRQVDVAIMRTLRLLAENLYQKKINITLLDEVLDSLDVDNSNLFCRYMKMVSQDQCIILVTHNLLTNSECDEIIRF